MKNVHFDTVNVGLKLHLGILCLTKQAFPAVSLWLIRQGNCASLSSGLHWVSVSQEMLNPYLQELPHLWPSPSNDCPPTSLTHIKPTHPSSLQICLHLTFQVKVSKEWTSTNVHNHAKRTLCFIALWRVVIYQATQQIRIKEICFHILITIYPGKIHALKSTTIIHYPILFGAFNCCFNRDLNVAFKHSTAQGCIWALRGKLPLDTFPARESQRAMSIPQHSVENAFPFIISFTC